MVRVKCVIYISTYNCLSKVPKKRACWIGDAELTGYIICNNMYCCADGHEVIFQTGTGGVGNHKSPLIGFEDQ